MGCSASRKQEEDDDAIVKLCRERKGFVRQALKQRSRFASGHAAYIRSLRRVSLALRDFVEGEEEEGHIMSGLQVADACRTSPPEAGTARLPPPAPSSARVLPPSAALDYSVVSGGNPSVSVEEIMPASPESVWVDGHFPFPLLQTSYVDSVFYPPHRSPPALAPEDSSPENSQWRESFWNPFSTMGTQHWYPLQSRIFDDDAIIGGEMVPQLCLCGEATGEDGDKEFERGAEAGVEAGVEAAGSDEHPAGAKTGAEETLHDVKELLARGAEGLEMTEAENNAELDSARIEQETAGDMSGALRMVENQFMRICDCAYEFLLLLEAPQSPPVSFASSVLRRLNPAALLRSASSRSSSSSRFLLMPPPPSSSPAEDENSERDADVDEIETGSHHHSTLDRLYAWEKKLYEEVKVEERLRAAYEKKSMQLKSQDMMGEDSSVVDRTRLAMRDLGTQLKVSVRSIEAIAKRIDALRDEELHPQLANLIKGLSKMWAAMADSHRTQKRAADAAKHLLPVTTPRRRCSDHPTALAQSASALESEVRNWRSAFRKWIAAQRAYAHALTGWLLRCRPPADLSPPRPEPEVFGLCVQWSRLLDSVGDCEAAVLEGMEVLAAGVGDVARRLREEEKARRKGLLVEVAEEEGADEVGVRVVWSGMAVTVDAMVGFAGACEEGYRELEKRFLGGGGDICERISWYCEEARESG